MRRRRTNQHVTGRARVLLLGVLAFALIGCGSGGEPTTPDHSGTADLPQPSQSASAPTAISPTGVEVEGLSPAAIGMHVNRLADEYWPDVHLGAIRIWNADSTWGALEKSQGSWNFAALDQRVAQATERQAKTLLVLAQPPAWAATRPDLKSYGGSPSPPKNIDDWRTYVRTVATRYKGRIEAYEIFNEPNLVQFFVGTPQDLSALTKAAAEEIRAADPAALVVSPGFSARTAGAEAYFKAYVDEGIVDAVDIVGIHIYPYPGNGPESMVTLAARFRELADAAGLADKPMWNTEIGYGRTPDSVFSGDTAASLVLRTFLVLPVEGVDRSYWYAWDDRQFVGLYLVDADLTTPTPAGYAFVEAQKWLIGAAIDSCTNADSLWTCTMLHPDGALVTVMWNLGGNTQTTVPAGSTLAYTFTKGAAATVTAGAKVTVGQLPVLFSPISLPTLD